MKLLKPLAIAVVAMLLVGCGGNTPTSSPSVPVEPTTSDPTVTPTSDPTEPPFVAPDAISLIGTIGDGEDWNTDYDLESSDQGHVWVIEDFLMLEGEEWKIRKNHNWGTAGTDNWGYSYLDETSKGLFTGSDNIVVTTSAYYTVSFDYDSYAISVSKGEEYVEQGWNETELALIEEHIYGIEVPYMYFEGNTELFYDAEWDLLSLTGAQVVYADLVAYKDLFVAEGWTLIADIDIDGVYMFEKAVEHEGITKYVTADLYALGEHYDEETGEYYYEHFTEGTLWLDLYDQYYYEWPTEEFQTLVKDATGTDVVVPAFEGASRYALLEYMADYGYAYIYLYTDIEDPVAHYESILEGAGWTIYVENDITVAMDPTETCGVQYQVDPDAGTFDIIAVPISSSVDPLPPDGSDPLDEFANAVKQNFEDMGYPFGPEWNDTYERYELALSFGESTDDSEDNLKGAAYALYSYIPTETYDFGVYMDQYNDPSTGGTDVFGNGINSYVIVLLEETYMFAVEIVAYVYGGVLYCQMIAYSVE